jgi:hypothetical protein
MPRVKKPRAELIRVAPQMDLETLDALIQKRVAEAQASQGSILEPWFQSPTVAAEIRRHQSIFHKRKFALYFERWGCLLCGTKKEPHASHAMCNRCVTRFAQRLAALEGEYAAAHPQEYQDQQTESITARARSAEQILLGTARPVRDSEE